jgi:hypothetical protein
MKIFRAGHNRSEQVATPLQDPFSQAYQLERDGKLAEACWQYKLAIEVASEMDDELGAFLALNGARRCFMMSGRQEDVQALDPTIEEMARKISADPQLREQLTHQAEKALPPELADLFLDSERIAKKLR